MKQTKDETPEERIKREGLMNQDTADFLETLLWLADDPDEKKRPLINASIWQFDPLFVSEAARFLDGFKRFLSANGFDLFRLEGLERSFGGNVYFSLSGHGCGFWDDKANDLDEWLELYSVDDLRFRELEHNLWWHRRGRKGVISLCLQDQYLEDSVRNLFRVTPDQVLRQVTAAGRDMADLLAAKLAFEADPTSPDSLCFEERAAATLAHWHFILDLKRPEPPTP